MCGRFYIAGDFFENTFASNQLPSETGPSLKTAGEICPSDLTPVFTSADGLRVIRPMIWGFPRWDGRGLIFNARRESALEKKLFRQSLLERRMAVPSNGFFEWTPVPGQKKKDRYLFTLPGDKFLFLAGFWNTFKDTGSGESGESFTILTTEANESMIRFHNRMPVILSEAEVDDWLSGSSFQNYLDRAQPLLQAEKHEPQAAYNSNTLWSNLFKS